MSWWVVPWLMFGVGLIAVLGGYLLTRQPLRAVRKDGAVPADVGGGGRTVTGDEADA